MRPDKEIKQWFKREASKTPEQYYAVRVLKERGYERRRCARCGTYFWSVEEGREVCGDASCAGGFTLFENNPCRKAMDYIELWRAFARMFKQKGYAVTPRYPVVARWNPTMDFTIASIAAFQPHVVSGEASPPAPLLVIPQFCLRFSDVDNVGVTMSHMTGFVMIGQHAFVPKEAWDQERFFTDIFDWLTEGLGLPYDEITFHEDAWAGGGNFGPCMEFFSRGVELGNQVYMLFEQDDDAPGGYRELARKVLDMGMGHERNAWFSQGKGTIYDAAFPTVMERLKAATGVTVDEDVLQRYIPHAAYLNLDEIDDVGAAWERVAQAVGMPAQKLREAIEPLTALYSIAEHARALLLALTDGALPSNVGGGYNLRIIFRRAQGFIDKYAWKLDLAEIAAWHAAYLAPLFPKVSEQLDEVKKILGVELAKYRENKRRAQHIIEHALKQPITAETLVTLYDTQGIQPEDVRAAARERGITVVIPERFYALVAERQEVREHKTQTRRRKRYALDGVPKTKILYYDSYDYTRFESPVVKVLEGNKVILERTAFYPTSGGQEHDEGTLGGVPVTDVIKQDGVIIHVLEKPVTWQPGELVTGVVDIERRRQLAQHHTATHIINGAARKVLGDHVWQAGAAKTMEKGRIDITHYAPLTNEELRAIEQEANRIVQANLPVKKSIAPKQLAEAAHGFRLYQGGAVPGREIRVVEIPGFDTEACGGTHLNTTGEAGTIRLLGSRKVQDGIIRIEFTAGKAAEGEAEQRARLAQEVAEALGVEEREIPAAAERLFTAWKKLRKAAKKQRALDVSALLSAKLEPYGGDVISEAAKRLQTQPEHLLKTIKRFSTEIAALRKSIPRG
ncbi:alanine--tRNA ligase [Candidatus Woesearchaeota archaeon]|nr:MAG: alanine--tRNA ligase [Candidatus Woesearchaeota archaeon]